LLKGYYDELKHGLGGYPGDITFRIWDQYRGDTGDANVNQEDSSWVYTDIGSILSINFFV
jgi:hypothetical protein